MSRHYSAVMSAAEDDVYVWAVEADGTSPFEYPVALFEHESHAVAFAAYLNQQEATDE